MLGEDRTVCAADREIRCTGASSLEDCTRCGRKSLAEQNRWRSSGFAAGTQIPCGRRGGKVKRLLGIRPALRCRAIPHAAAGMSPGTDRNRSTYFAHSSLIAPIVHPALDISHRSHRVIKQLSSADGPRHRRRARSLDSSRIAST
jgi:hypothetical protein